MKEPFHESATHHVRRRSRFIALLPCLVVSAVLGAGVAGAISDGVPDTEHPNVGALLVETDPQNRPGRLVPVCTGSLLSPNHFLTSGHCLVPLEQHGLGPQNVAVTFDQNALAPTTVVRASGVSIHPSALQQRSDADDVGIVTLATPVTDIQAIQLPTEGFLDEVAARGELVGHSFVNVGYGVIPTDRGEPNFQRDPIRRVSTSPFKGLTPAYLLLNMRTDATGEGGVCYGDSGSPKFFEPVPGARSNLVPAITFGGDRICRAHNYNQRLDIPSVRSFLDDFVQVP